MSSTAPWTSAAGTSTTRFQPSRQMTAIATVATKPSEAVAPAVVGWTRPAPPPSSAVRARPLHVTSTAWTASSVALTMRHAVARCRSTSRVSASVRHSRAIAIVSSSRTPVVNAWPRDSAGSGDQRVESPAQATNAESGHSSRHTTRPRCDCQRFHAMPASTTATSARVATLSTAIQSSDASDDAPSRPGSEKVTSISSHRQARTVVTGAPPSLYRSPHRSQRSGTAGPWRGAPRAWVASCTNLGAWHRASPRCRTGRR